MVLTLPCRTKNQTLTGEGMTESRNTCSASLITRRCAVAIVCLFFQMIAPPDFRCYGNAQPASPIGNWRGESICVGNRPACKNEDVVYRVEGVPGRPSSLIVFADKIIEGKREPMGKLDFSYDQASGTLSSEFTRGQTHGLWEFTLSGDKMEGKLLILPDRSVARKVGLKRVNENQIPPAPPRDQY